jgi:hypothetical protein
MTQRKERVCFDKNLLYQFFSNNLSKLNKNYENTNRDTVIDFTCPCGNKYEKTLRQIINVSGAFCKECTVKNKLNKSSKTLKIKHGVENPGQMKDHVEKMKIKNLEKTGYEFASQSPEIKEKVKQTNLKNCGYEFALQSPEIKEKTKQTNLKNLGVEYPMQSEKVQEKLRQNNLKKYKYKYYFQIPEVIKKLEQTHLRNLGVINPFQSEVVKEKIKQTNLKIRGYEHALQSPECIEKFKQTCYDRYGVDHPAKTKEFQEKIFSSGISRKEFKMPSGDIRMVQGYEPKALSELVLNYKEDDIKTGVLNIPLIEYILENKNRIYFPDIFIPSENKIIEVKSDWTFIKDFEKNLAKAKQCKKEGYLFEFWVYDKKFNKRIF